jgi:hypothetical protein
LIAFGIITPCWSDETIEWSHSGHWTVMIDPSAGNGCFIIGSYTNGEIFRVGLDNTRKSGYVMIANPAWRSLQLGRSYRLSLQFDKESPWEGTFSAIAMGNTIALVNYFDKGSFLRDIADKDAVTIYFEGRFVANLPLPGTDDAVRALIDCQDKVNDMTSRRDPFGGDNARPATDPFSRRR